MVELHRFGTPCCLFWCFGVVVGCFKPRRRRSRAPSSYVRSRRFPVRKECCPQVFVRYFFGWHAELRETRVVNSKGRARADDVHQERARPPYAPEKPGDATLADSADSRKPPLRHQPARISTQRTYRTSAGSPSPPSPPPTRS
ncbi:uncharacterized protein EV422DRAFT_282930 [Fimicolochytrium jonesii]|uniref:uncharacterized protein n=1 Tax=Fimicolochytrium jonesii TaxID=1396493 RepID=UPI0022FE6667|nr:uncharacterized protein EV422DRAFT_282930 [Fimicolochytrium jonesii]KAI8816452.1 hypothetical protein EV422DRAFT_282930 [Fimicolochytrium jonesii]